MSEVCAGTAARPLESRQSERLSRNRRADWSAIRHSVTFLNLPQKADKHWLFIKSSVVSEAVLIEIGLQVVTANVVIHAADAALYEAPEAFDGVGVDVVSGDVNFFAVINAPMLISANCQSIVGSKLISEHGALGHDMFAHDADESISLHVSGDHRTDAALALDNADNRGLAFSVANHRTSSVTLAATAIICLVHLYTALAAKLARFLFVQHRADLFEHAPRCFVSDASLALNLFRGNSATRLGHQVDRIKPSGQRSRRLVEDRVCGWMNVMTAMVARIRRTAHDAMMFCYRFALDAVDAVWVEIVLQPLKTGRIIRVLTLEIFQGVLEHFRFAIVVGHGDYLLSGKSLALIVPTVKG
jgi:hypothetical protein